MPVSKIERETIINFNEAENTASIYTHSPALRRLLQKIAADRPEECRQEPKPNADADGYTVPKAWIKIKPPRAISEAQKAHLAALHRKPPKLPHLD